MPVSRIKNKNHHLKKKSKKPLNLHHPATQVAGAMMIAGTLISTHDILLQNAPIVQATTYSQAAFIERIASSAKPVADANGLYPSVMIAQAILESMVLV